MINAEIQQVINEAILGGVMVALVTEGGYRVTPWYRADEVALMDGGIKVTHTFHVTISVHATGMDVQVAGERPLHTPLTGKQTIDAGDRITVVCPISIN